MVFIPSGITFYQKGFSLIELSLFNVKNTMPIHIRKCSYDPFGRNIFSKTLQPTACIFVRCYTTTATRPSK